MKRLCFMFVLIVFAMAMAVPAIGEEPQKAPATTKEVPLEEKVKALEKKVEDIEKITTKEDAKLKEEKKERAIAYYRDGFFIETPDKKFSLQIGGVMHFDTRVFAGDTQSPSSFDIRRARYDIRGYHYRGDIESMFRIQVEMADPIALRNMYWMFKFRPEFNLQIGQFKVPSGGADWLTEEAHVNFIEYATERPVAPDFDRGFNIHSSFLGGKIQTNLAMVNGTGYDVDYASGDWDDHKNYIGRILLVPFKDAGNKLLKGMHFAGAYETGLQSIKTVRGERDCSTENLQSKWFKWKAGTVTGTGVDIEKRNRYGGEFHWIVGPAALSYEFNRVQWEDVTYYSNTTTGAVDRTKSLAGDSHADVHQIWVSYFLTGEQKAFEDVFFAWRQPKPKKNFSLKNGTWGAWEAIARYAYHDTSKQLFDKGILEGTWRGYSVTGGVRWIWNPKCRIMLDVNYLKSLYYDKAGKVGLVTEYAATGARQTGYTENETAFLLRFILTP